MSSTRLDNDFEIEPQDDLSDTIDACRKIIEYKEKADALLEVKTDDSTFKKENYREAIHYYQELIELYKQTNARHYYYAWIYKKIATSCTVLAKLEEADQIYDEAINCFHVALDYFEIYPANLKDDEQQEKFINQIDVHFSLAEIYFVNNDFRNALGHLKEGLTCNNKTTPSLEHSKRNLDGFKNVISCLIQFDSKDKAISYCHRAITICNSLASEYNQPMHEELEKLKAVLSSLTKLPQPPAQVVVTYENQQSATNQNHTLEFLKNMNKQPSPRENKQESRLSPHAPPSSLSNLSLFSFQDFSLPESPHSHDTTNIKVKRVCSVASTSSTG